MLPLSVRNSTLLVFLVLAANVLALNRGHTSVFLERGTIFVRNRAQVHRRALDKHAGFLARHNQLLLGKRDTSAEKTEYNPTTTLFYAGYVTLGTPPQRFLINFDSGSADLWVPSSRCTSTTCQSHRHFDEMASSSYMSYRPERGSLRPSRIRIEYGTGVVSIDPAQDTLKLGSIRVHNVSFGKAVHMTPDFDSQFDGLFGMAFPSLSSPRLEPPFFTMARQRLLNENQFSFTLGEKGGRLDIGKASDSAKTEHTSWVKLVKPQFWAVNVNGIEVEMSHTAAPASASASAPEALAFNQSSVDKREVLPLLPPQVRILEKHQLPLTDEHQDTTISIRGAGIFDSGTTTILCPSQIATQINRLIGASDNGLHINCSASTTGPIFHFTVGNGHAGNSFTIPLSPHQYILGDGNPTHGCMSAFQPGGPQDRWILGLPFFVNRTLTFDIDNGRIGFSQLHNNASMFNNNGEVTNEQDSGFSIDSEEFGGYKDGPVPANNIFNATLDDAAANNSDSISGASSQNVQRFSMLYTVAYLVVVYIYL